jgi:MFS family permease
MGNEDMKSGEKAGLFGDTYYGWVIVAVALISMAFWFGIRTSFSVFYVALLENFPWTRAGSAGIQSMALITYTVLAPIVGGLIDRFGPRRVIGPGILVLTLGLVLCSTVETLTQFYLFYGMLTAAGVTCISIVPYTAILGHWFEKKRGLASGIAVSGMGLGTFILVPFSQHFITLWGWRLTFSILGGLVMIMLLPLNVVLLRHRPQDLGLVPDGLKMVSSSHKGDLKEISTDWIGHEWTLKGALRTGNFYALVAFPFFAAIGIYFIIVHHVKFLVDIGIDKMTAAFIFALIGIISLCFRIFWGWLSDHIGREKTYTMGVICMCLGVSSLLLIGAMDERWLVYPFFIFFGIGWGVTAPMFMAAAADLFKGKIIGLIYGIVEGCFGIGGALGAWIGGYVFDRTQSYQWAFVLAIVVFLLSGLFIWIAAPRKIYKTDYNRLKEST